MKYEKIGSWDVSTEIPDKHREMFKKRIEDYIRGDLTPAVLKRTRSLVAVPEDPKGWSIGFSKSRTGGYVAHAFGGLEGSKIDEKTWLAFAEAEARARIYDGYTPATVIPGITRDSRSYGASLVGGLLRMEERVRDTRIDTSKESTSLDSSVWDFFKGTEEKGDRPLGTPSIPPDAFADLRSYFLGGAKGSPGLLRAIVSYVGEKIASIDRPELAIATFVDIEKASPEIKMFKFDTYLTEPDKSLATVEEREAEDPFLREGAVSLFIDLLKGDCRIESRKPKIDSSLYRLDPSSE
jgi:hypothetical protein